MLWFEKNQQKATFQRNMWCLYFLNFFSSEKRMDQVIFPAAQGPIVGLSLSAIAIRRQKHLCAYRHLIGSPRCCFNVTLRGEGKT